MKSKLPFPKTGSRFFTTLRYMKAPYDCYRKWKANYGDTFMVNALNGDVLATCNPDNLRTALAASSDDVSQFATETTKPLVGASSVILINGPRHKQERRILSPSFGGACLGQYAPEIESIAERKTRDWSVGDKILVMDEALDVSLDVIIRVVFGVVDTELMSAFRRQIKKFVTSFHPILAFTQLFQRSWFGLSPWVRFQKEKQALDAMLNVEIERESRNDGPSRGMLGRILQEYREQDGAIDVENVRSQLITLLLAGHETTQIAIAWAMSWLHRNPEYVDRLRVELQSCDWITVAKESKLLDGVCQETLRLNTILPDVVRTLRSPIEWSGHELPVGTNIALAGCLVHEDESLYPDPFAFKPERWEDFKAKPHQFLPFGGGVRRCLGAPLSLLEMKIVILCWIGKFEFEIPADAPESEPVHRRNITMAPQTGIPLMIKATLS